MICRSLPLHFHPLFLKNRFLKSFVWSKIDLKDLALFNYERHYHTLDYSCSNGFTILENSLIHEGHSALDWWWSHHRIVGHGLSKEVTCFRILSDPTFFVHGFLGNLQDTYAFKQSIRFVRLSRSFAEIIVWPFVWQLLRIDLNMVPFHR